MNEQGRARHRIGALFALTAIAVGSIAAFLPSASAAKPRCFGHKATIVGTRGNNTIHGSNGRDVIVAKGGDDTIYAKRGRDFICTGGGGFDVVFAGKGNDRVDAERGFDLVFPSLGDDFIDGGTGIGALVTYEGSSRPINADLRASLITGQGRDRGRNLTGVLGSEADDVLLGNNRDNELWGLGGDDVARGRGGVDFLNAGAGDDTVAGGGGVDVLDLVIANGGPRLGNDVLATSGAAVNMPLGTVSGGADVGVDTFTGIEEVGTTLGDDSVVGDGGDNFIATWAGTDTLVGDDGDDILLPGPGDDTADGGSGNDAVDFFLSHPFEPGMDGPIDVDLSTQTAAGQGIDDLNSIEGAFGTLLDDTITGDQDTNNTILLGDEGSDGIVGGEGDDSLDGDTFFFGVEENLPGSDSLYGLDGNDTCLGGEITMSCETVGPRAPQAWDAQELASVGRHSFGLHLLRYRLIRAMR